MTIFRDLLSGRSQSRQNDTFIAASVERIEKQLQEAANETLERWQRETEVKLSESVSSLMNGLLGSLGNQLGARSRPPRVDLGNLLGVEGDLGNALRPVETQINRWIRGTVDDLFTREKTRVTSSTRETTRSQEALENFRQSRSQQQADTVIASQAGQRNL